MEQRQTAVEFLIDLINYTCSISINPLDFEQAKEMHKQEIKDAYNQGYRDGEIDAPSSNNEVDISEYTDAESYYNKKYGGNK